MRIDMDRLIRASRDGERHPDMDRRNSIHVQKHFNINYGLSAVTPTYKYVYLIGSLRNAEVGELGNYIRASGINVFDDWLAAGPEADDKWKEYEVARGRSYEEALKGEAARNVFQFDKRHLDAASAVVLVLPAGKSGHLELGYSIGRGKRTAILLDPNADPRWDVMYQFADQVFSSKEKLLAWLTTELGCSTVV